MGEMVVENKKGHRPTVDALFQYYVYHFRLYLGTGADALEGFL